MRSPGLVVRLAAFAAAVFVALAVAVPAATAIPNGDHAAVRGGSGPGRGEAIETAGTPTDADEEFDGRSTRSTVRLVVGSLVAIAGATTVMMLIYVWHTSPRRRLRIATRRAERRRAEVDVDDDADGVTLEELLGEPGEEEPDDWFGEHHAVPLGDLVAQENSDGDDDDDSGRSDVEDEADEDDDSEDQDVEDDDVEDEDIEASQDEEPGDDGGEDEDGEGDELAEADVTESRE